MPHTWALVDSSFPTFTEGESPQSQITALVNYMMILTEALKYQLENLDTNNWNTAALDDFQLDTTQDVTEQVAALAQQLKAVTGEVAAVKIRLTSTESHIGYLEAAQEQIEAGVEALEEQMGIAEADIDALKQTTDLIKRTEDGGTQIGKTDKNIYLVGKIYINGVLME